MFTSNNFYGIFRQTTSTRVYPDSRLVGAVPSLFVPATTIADRAGIYRGV